MFSTYAEAMKSSLVAIETIATGCTGALTKKTSRRRMQPKQITSCCFMWAKPE